MEISSVMYYQLNITTIIEKYCVNKERPQLHCNGKCYLMSQMKATTSTSSDDAKSGAITEAFIPLFFQDSTIQLAYNTSYFIDCKQHWRLKQTSTEDIPKNIDHPPQNNFFSQIRFSSINT